jgi:7-carboxy-7-deazaguanine synthase
MEIEKKYYYSEIFHSIQGEGHYTGVPTAWLRFFLCNLQCNGFGQINPTDGLFLHPLSGQHQHLCFTGGEPLMKHAQEAVVGILKELKKQKNLPGSITFETNGTQELTDDFVKYMTAIDPEIFFSISPKLWTVAGEKASKAIRPQNIVEYLSVSPHGQLKFVVGNRDEQWTEMESVITQFRDVGVDLPVWVMPVGAREEEQNATAGDVAKRAFQRGYNVAARVHVHLFGNAIGT